MESEKERSEHICSVCKNNKGLHTSHTAVFFVLGHSIIHSFTHLNMLPSIIDIVQIIYKYLYQI